jgi:protein-disulfide isomerase
MPISLRTAALAAGALVLAIGLAVVAMFQFAPAPAGDAAVERVVRDYLLENPEILIEMQGRLEEKQLAAEAQARDEALAKLGREALIDPNVAFVSGPADAKVTVVEFFDYRCGFCKASLPAIKAALEKHKDVRFAFVEFPILSPESLYAARAAVAARRQPGKYVPFHLALMESTGNLPAERVLDIARSVGLDVTQLQKDTESPATQASLQASNAVAQ